LMGCSGAPLMLFACVCPCVVAGNIGVALGADSLCQAAASSLCVSSLLDRQRVRKVYGIAGTDVSDCLAASCCAACSLSQLLLHLRAHPLPPPPPPTAAWPVRLFDVRKAGFCSRCCWSLCCSPCAFAQIQERKRLGGEHDSGREAAGEKQQVEPTNLGNRRCTSACVVACSTVCVGWLVWRSRMHTRAALHIPPGKYACLSDCAAALCCTSFALVQEAAAWGLYEQADASEHDASEHAAPQDDQGDTPKTKNCMSCMPRASKPA
jgi:Cys-rich protein (TIGR01571 family)